MDSLANADGEIEDGEMKNVLLVRKFVAWVQYGSRRKVQY